MNRNALSPLALVLATAVLAAAPSAEAQITSVLTKYPIDACVSGQQKAAGKYCGAVLKAQGKFLNDPLKAGAAATLSGAIDKAEAKFSSSYQKELDKSASKDVDCSEAGVDYATMVASIDADVASVIATLNSSGCDESSKGKIAGGLAKLCDGILKGESKHMKGRAKDPNREKLNAGRAKVDAKYAGVGTKYPCTDVAALGATLTASVEARVSDTVTAVQVDGTPLVIGDWVEIAPGTFPPLQPSLGNPLRERDPAASLFPQRRQ